MKASKIFLFLCLVFSSSCSRPPVATAVLDRESEEYKIYSVLIRDKFLKQAITTVVVKDETGIHPLGKNYDLGYIKRGLTGTTQELIDDFAMQNREPFPLKDRFDVNATIILFDKEKQQQIFIDGKGWERFYEIYPNSQGIATFSKVGFNRQGDQALVYYGNQEHWLAGTGYFVLFEKKNGEWSIKSELMVWIS